MAQSTATRIPAILKTHEKDLLADWIKSQLSATTLRSDLLKEADLREQSRAFLNLLQETSQKASLEDFSGAGWSGIKDMLGELSRARAQAGFSPAETATFVFSLKQPLFARLRAELKNDPEALADELWRASSVLDSLVFTRRRFISRAGKISSRGSSTSSSSCPPRWWSCGRTCWRCPSSERWTAPARRSSWSRCCRRSWTREPRSRS
jgi:rsbT co-antagonist protein RsbR